MQSLVSLVTSSLFPKVTVEQRSHLPLLHSQGLVIWKTEAPYLALSVEGIQIDVSNDSERT